MLCCIVSNISAQNAASSRLRLNFDDNWSFAFGHPSDASKDFNHGTSYFSYLAKAGYGDGPADIRFDDRSWRKLNLPHDWAVEQPFSQKASFSHGFKAIGRNFPEKSVGWYRKTFDIPASDLGHRIVIEFDGAFRNSAVWVNGHYLGTEPSGYLSFHYDITDVINYGGRNVIAVRVDATLEEGWYYEGAGIYRHVWLNKTAPLHVMKDGTFVTSKIAAGNALVMASSDVINEGKSEASFQLIHTITDASGNTIASEKIKQLHLRPFEKKTVGSTISVANAKLWSIDTPSLYKLTTRIIQDDKEVDRFDTKFGIRSIRFDPKLGFFLNDKPVKLKGTNNHQDHAGVGTAIPDELQYWRISKLKEMGSNAYRCSHHPPTPELLEACDELGMLVIDENRLMQTTAQGLSDLKRMIMRDRNHPSIISWSIGNEEWAIENNETGQRIALTLQHYANSLDSTRLATAGISGGFRSGIADVLQLMGYNYLGNGDIDAHQKRLPQQPGLGSEEGSTFATRGIYITDDAKHYRAAYDQKPRPSFYSIQEGWRFYDARPYLAGMFIWTGFDYRGEPTPYGWPSMTSYFGMMDLCGFPKDNVFYLRAWWQDKPVLHVFPHWNWPGQEGKEIPVWIYSNCDEVELLLNRKSLGKKSMEKNGHLEWKVKYEPGIVEAIGFKNGRKVLTNKVQTTGTAVSLRLTPHKNELKANTQDLAVITVDIIDKNNLAIATAQNDITFEVEGPARIIGVGNGDPTSMEPEKFVDSITTFSIADLKEIAINGYETINESNVNIVEGKWLDAFVTRDYKNLPAAYLTKGTFGIAENTEGSRITLFYKPIGIRQTIYINGRVIASDLSQLDAADGLVLNAVNLKAGKNTIHIVSTPLPKKYDWDVVNTDPGVVQMFKPATSWKRKLFNGLAQVILQATAEPGEIRIHAKSSGVKTATLKLQASTN